MPVTVQLLGSPSITVDGMPGPRPRGRKAWALLAMLLLAERPPTRRQLAELLFPEADDPLGSVRWTLAELRRMLGGCLLIEGDPVVAERTSPDHVIDVLDLTDAARAGSVVDALALGELLDGFTGDTSAAFESWLVVERYRMSAAAEAALRRATLSALVAGRVADAVRHAGALVSRNPLDESNHVLLVRCLVAAGDRAAAAAQVEVCRTTLRRELGVDVSVALIDAAATPLGTITRTPSIGRAAAVAQLDAGRAAIAAGAVEAGIDCLRRAVTEANAAHDGRLQAEALLALGGALVHSVRGFDDEGSVVLHEAIAAAEAVGDQKVAATAHRELGFVEIQAGRHVTGDAFLQRAEDLADGDAELAAVLGTRGMGASDRGDYATAFDHLHRSIEAARRSADERQHAWSLSILGRAHLLREEHAAAADAVERSLALVRAQRWLAFLPWPQALRAELALRAADEVTARDEFEQSWALATQLGDPCWEGVAARGLALISARGRQHDDAVRWSEEARIRCSRVPDRYQWIRGYVLDAAAAMALERGDVVAATAATDALEVLSARCDLRELVVRAHLHRARLGSPQARTAARLLADGIDNPALEALL